VLVFDTPQKSYRPPFWNNLSHGVKIYAFEVIFNGMNPLTKFQKESPLIGYNVTWGHTNGKIIVIS
jgi:hypothetical protein